MHTVYSDIISKITPTIMYYLLNCKALPILYTSLLAEVFHLLHYFMLLGNMELSESDQMLKVKSKVTTA